MRMSDNELAGWLAHGQLLTETDYPVGGTLSRDVVQLWRVVGALGEKVLDLEAKL